MLENDHFLASAKTRIWVPFFKLLLKENENKDMTEKFSYEVGEDCKMSQPLLRYSNLKTGLVVCKFFWRFWKADSPVLSCSTAGKSWNGHNKELHTWCWCLIFTLLLRLRGMPHTHFISLGKAKCRKPSNSPVAHTANLWNNERITYYPCLLRCDIVIWYCNLVARDFRQQWSTI